MSEDSRESSIILFGERAAGVYLLSEIYNPEIDGVSPEASGKIVPALGSQVVKLIVTASGVYSQLYTVVSVDPITFASQLEPTGAVPRELEDDTRLVSYGNNIFMLYYAPVVITTEGGQVLSLTKLVIDNKFSVFGNHAATYRLAVTTQGGTKSIISVGYSSAGVNTGSLVSMIETAVPGVRKCNSCYTTYGLTDGTMVACEIFDAAGLMIATVNLTAKAAHYLNDVNTSANPIIGFDILGNQYDDSDGKLYLLAGQDIGELAIYPRITYANHGLTQVVAIDGVSGFVYGLEDVQSSVPGTEYTVTVKYYVNNDVVSDLIENEGTDRFMSTTAVIKIISRSSFDISKISVAPMWDSVSSSWSMSYRGYRVDRSDPNGPLTGNFVTTTGFDGALFNQEQTITMTVAGDGVSSGFTQDLIIELRDYDEVDAGGVRWLLRDSNTPTADAYGDNTNEHIRPCIKFDTGINNYVIPTSGDVRYAVVANNNQTAQEVFLENFYYKSSPPLLGGETVPPVPTHFRIINPSTGSGISQFKDVALWHGNLNLTYTGLATQYVGGTLVIEFMVSNGDGTYSFIFSAPVDVIPA